MYLLYTSIGLVAVVVALGYEFRRQKEAWRKFYNALERLEES